MPPHITEPASIVIKFASLFDSQKAMFINCILMEIVKLQKTSCMRERRQQLLKKSQFMEPSERGTEGRNDREKTDKTLTGLLSNRRRKSCYSLTQSGPVRWFDGYFVKH
jgi:hypothetical protein